MHLLYIAVVTTALMALAHGGYKTKCEVVEALRAEGVPDCDLRDWLCLVKHESNYEYSLRKTNSDGSKDHGIFQLNSNYWCDMPEGYNGTTCWRLDTFGCQYTCSSFEDSDISNDSNCAVRIQDCSGFGKWDGHSQCSESEKAKSEYDFDDC